MKTISEIRLENARSLADTMASRAAFARLLGMSDAYMWQILGNKPVRNIGSAMARRIERACAKPEAWLDTEHQENSDGHRIQAKSGNEDGQSISADAARVAAAFDRRNNNAQRAAVMAQLVAFGVL